MATPGLPRLLGSHGCSGSPGEVVGFVQTKVTDSQHSINPPVVLVPKATRDTPVSCIFTGYTVPLVSTSRHRLPLEPTDIAGGSWDDEDTAAARTAEASAQDMADKWWSASSCTSNSPNMGQSSGGMPSEVPLEGITTLMVRNVPADVTQPGFLEELNISGFAGLYDFCYMPSFFATGKTKGYAFVNFATSSVAGSFTGAWHQSRRFGASMREPAINISPAELQGKQANIAKWNTSRLRRIRNPSLRPFVQECRPATALSQSSQGDD
eukprot:CAMPEP_0197889114 /NCGR_PEP_ID=MMETSP1439-20131203/23471_1 /TAXON_ID=66791 /ORGANISM="Gonyaulax spinifera, Strain CCMP409" /LENGTH=266 /DNA_ID=CAMNT_0043509069 /DNA_START=106 /DNA_END=906 /DNA_ORIENTATION=-